MKQKELTKREIFSKKEYASEDSQLQTVPFGNIDKTICGCGLTTVAIESDENVIIAMPTVPLVVNKVEQYPNERCKYKLFPVYAKITKADIDEYVYQCGKDKQPIKIITTFDGVRKVEEYLDNCRLIIDESNQILSLTKDSQRKDNILKMLEIAEKRKETVSLISATPIDLKYMPDWIGQIEQVKITWENTIKSVPILMERAYPFKSLREELIKPLESDGFVTIANKTFSSLIIFLNSVEQITNTIKECKLDVKECRIICGDSVRNDLRISGIERYKVKDKFKYLFVTKSGFSGMDVESSDAMTVVISNTSKEWQMVDILTDLKQAVSRQRLKDNPNYGFFVYIYNQSVFTYTEEELMDRLLAKRDKIEKAVLIYEDAKRANRKEGFMVDSDFTSYSIYDSEKDCYTVNDSAFNADMYYLLEIRRQYTKGFDIKGTFDHSLDAIKVELPKIPSYIDYVEYFNDNHQNGQIEWGEYSAKTDWITLIESSYKLYKTTWQNYTYAKEMVENYGDAWEILRITIKNMFRKGRRYTRKEVKDRLQKLYDTEGIKRNARYSDLYEIFEKEQVREIKVQGERYIEIQ